MRASDDDATMAAPCSPIEALEIRDGPPYRDIYSGMSFFAGRRRFVGERTNLAR